MRELIDNLFGRLGLNNSGYLPGENPLMAAGMCVRGVTCMRAP